MAKIRPCASDVATGWIFDGSTFAAAPPPPVTYTPKQLAQVLMDDPSPAGTFARGLVAVLAQRFSLTPQQIIAVIANAAS